MDTIIAQHYNVQKVLSLVERTQSTTVHLKNFNNWIKTILINNHTQPNDSVLDLCAGKGGDFLKWSKAKIGSLTHVDIAQQSIQQAQARVPTPSFFPITFLVADCCQSLPLDAQYDLVSCQFALHYAFETESRMHAFFHNVRSRLKSGGHFIGTIPDANMIKKRLIAAEGLIFGNELYRIEFESDSSTQYRFSLRDAVEGCPEWLVDPAQLERVGAEYGLTLLYLKSFSQYYQEHRFKYRYLLSRMNVFNRSGTLSNAEWEVVNLYLVFAFELK